MIQTRMMKIKEIQIKQIRDIKQGLGANFKEAPTGERLDILSFKKDNNCNCNH